MLTYLGVSDANAVLPGGVAAGPTPAVELSFNCVRYSASLVEQGTYSFWGYAHVMYRSTQTGLPKTFGDNLSNQVLSLSTAPCPQTWRSVIWRSNVTVTEHQLRRSIFKI